MDDEREILLHVHCPGAAAPRPSHARASFRHLDATFPDRLKIPFVVSLLHIPSSERPLHLNHKKAHPHLKAFPQARVGKVERYHLQHACRGYAATALALFFTSNSAFSQSSKS